MGTIGDVKDLLIIGALGVGAILIYKFTRDPVKSVLENPVAIAIAPPGVLTAYRLANWIFSMGDAGGNNNIE